MLSVASGDSLKYLQSECPLWTEERVVPTQSRGRDLPCSPTRNSKGLAVFLTQGSACASRWGTTSCCPLPSEDLCDAVSPTQEPHALPDVNFPSPALLWVSWKQLLRCAKLTLGNSSCVREQIPPRPLRFQWFLTNYPCPCRVPMGHPTTGERLLLLSSSLSWVEVKGSRAGS